MVGIACLKNACFHINKMSIVPSFYQSEKYVSFYCWIILKGYIRCPFKEGFGNIAAKLILRKLNIFWY